MQIPTANVLKKRKTNLLNLFIVQRLWMKSSFDFNRSFSFTSLMLLEKLYSSWLRVPINYSKRVMGVWCRHSQPKGLFGYLKTAISNGNGSYLPFWMLHIYKFWILPFFSEMVRKTLDYKTCDCGRIRRILYPTVTSTSNFDRFDTKLDFHRKILR